jgi:endoglucanase
VAQAAKALLEPLMDEVSITRLGSVLGVRRCGRENAPKLLLDAHLDEIGFLVTGHEDGFLRFAPLGGVDPRMLPDREVTILTQPPMLGVVACLPPHIQTAVDMDKAVPISESYLDVGLTQEQAQARVPIGTPITFRGSCAPLGQELLRGKAMDDRACFAILLDAVERLKDKQLNVDLYLLGSTQEEVNSAGAITATYGAAPDCCVAVDVTHGATPDAKKEGTFPLGEGPVIGVGPNCTRWMSDRMQALAKELDIPSQIEVMAGHSGTNAWPMQISREGVATAVLSLPLRYMHTPIEVCSRADLEQTARLLAEFVLRLGEEVEPGC